MEPNEEVKSPLEEAKEVLAEIKKVTAESREEADRLSRLKADDLLSGTAGIRPVIEPPKELTAKEYKDYIEKHGRPPQ